MNSAPVLVGYTAVVGFVAPPLMLRAGWPHRAPALAAAVWQALAVSFSIGVALSAYNLVMPTEHLHAGLVGLLHSCGLDMGSGRPNPDAVGRLAVGAPAALAIALAAAFVFHVTRARRARTEHRETLDLVGRHSVGLRATVLPYDVPAAYCLPGRHPRIVISDAAVRELTPEQLGAVLEHEQAHITLRHHLVLAATEAFHSVFRWLPWRVTPESRRHCCWRWSRTTVPCAAIPATCWPPRCTRWPQHAPPRARSRRAAIPSSSG